MRVAEICTHKTVCIFSEQSIQEAARLMRRKHVGALVVIEQPNGEQLPIGILTDRDIVLAVVAEGIDAQTLTVADVMSRNPVTCGQDQDLADAIELMRAGGLRRLPVVNAAGGVVGLLAADDVYSALGTYIDSLNRAFTTEQVHEMEQRA